MGAEIYSADGQNAWIFREACDNFRLSKSFCVRRCGVRRSSRPVGVVLYTRDGFDRITVMHLVVAEEFAAGGSRADSQLLLRLVNAIRRVARTTTGIRHVELLYSAGRARTPLLQGWRAAR